MHHSSDDDDNDGVAMDMHEEPDYPPAQPERAPLRLTGK